MSSRVQVKIDADKTGFDVGMKSIHHSFEEMKHMVAGAFTVEAVAGLVEKTFEYAETIDKASLRMKITTEETQALSLIAKDAGSSLETVETAFRKIELARAKALGGDKKSLASFDALGIDIKDLQKQGNITELGGKIAGAAGRGSNEFDGIALAGLGLKGAAGDLTAIGESLGNLHEKVEELKAAGAIMPDEDIANMVRAKDELEVISTVALAKIAPYISDAIEGVMMGAMMIKAAFTNLFSTIILLADHTLDYIKGLGASLSKGGKGALSGAVTGFATGGIAGGVTGLLTGAFSKDNKLTKDFMGNVGNDIKTGWTGIGDDINDGLNEMAADKAKMLADRAKQRQNNGGEDLIPVAKNTEKKEHKLYSDSLTAAGNFMGASFRGVGAIVNQMDVAKRQLNVSQKQNENQVKANDLLKTIADNTANNESTDNTPWDN